MHRCKYSIAAFTLIELSIVIVIIGLIVGGILVGKDLIKTAELRSQISQIENMITATNNFRLKYNYLPGDMPPTQASQLGFFTFTGACAGKTSGDYAYGNNDGIINLANERLPFWSHLGDSSLISGTYSGRAGSLLKASAACGDSDSGQNTSPFPYPMAKAAAERYYPLTKIDGYFINVFGNYYFSPAKDYVMYSDARQSNIFSVNDIGTGTGFPASSAYYVDNKMDDGFPVSGWVRTLSTTNCVVSNSYDLTPATADQKRCAMDFLW